MEIERDELQRMERVMATQGRDDGEPPREPMSTLDLAVSLGLIGSCAAIAWTLADMAADLFGRMWVDALGVVLKAMVEGAR